MDKQFHLEIEKIHQENLSENEKFIKEGIEVVLPTGYYAGKQLKNVPILYIPFLEVLTRHNKDLHPIVNAVQEAIYKLPGSFVDDFAAIFDGNFLLTVGQFLSIRRK